LETKSNKKFKAKRFLPALEKLLKSKAKQASLFAGFHVVFQFTRPCLRVLPGLRTGLFRHLWFKKPKAGLSSILRIFNL
jgi:hypothetical protein